MAAGANTIEKYNLALDFERELAVACAARPALYGLLGCHLEPGAFADPAAALVVRAVRAHGEEYKTGPGTAAVISQRLCQWRDDGRVTQEEIDGVFDLFMEVAEPAPNAELIGLMKPLLARRIQRAAVTASISEWQKGGDFGGIIEQYEAARRIGVSTAGTGMRLGGGEVLGELASLSKVGRLATGMADLDLLLKGGTPCRTFTLFIAPSGGGKSSALIQQAVHAMCEGHLVAYATLELSRPFITARVLANLFDIPYAPLEDGDPAALEYAGQRLTAALPSMGTLVIEEFPPGATYVADLREWVKRIEREEGRKVTVLLIDYIDDMVSEKASDKSLYDAQGTVVIGLGEFAREHNLWVSSASQAKRRQAGDKKRRVEIDDVSDSLKKVQKSDVVIGISQPDDDGLTVELNVAKNRFGQRKLVAGPLPHNLGNAQLVGHGAYR